MFDRIFDLETWHQLLQSDFNRGYLAALAIYMALFIALMVLRFLFWLAFRTRGCSEVVVPCRDGDIVVSRDAVTMAVSHELADFPALDVRKIRLFRRGKVYSMTLLCVYGGGESGIPELAANFKPRIIDSLKSTFGIDSLKRIKVVVEKMDAPQSRPAEAKERIESAPVAVEVPAADGQ